jgi:hypothetical protein
MIALALVNPFSKEEFDKWWESHANLDDAIGDMGRAGALAAWEECEKRFRDITGSGNA